MSRLYAWMARVLVCVFSLIGAGLGIQPAFAQTGTATLSGIVTDQSGGVLSDALVTATNEATGLQRQGKTDGNGQFVFPALSPGRYRLSASRDGFVPSEIPELVLNVSDAVAMTIGLAIAGVGESVTVEASPARVSTSPAVSTVIDRQFVENLPMSGRSFHTLLSLTPGVVVTDTNAGKMGQFSVNGQRSSANYFTIDGVSANFAPPTGTAFLFANGSIPAFSSDGGGTLVSLEALEEMRIQTSTYAPEFGRSPGAQVSLTTRSGTRSFSGSVYEFFRHEKLDANDWFANRAGVPKAPLRLNNFGGVLGGPIPLPSGRAEHTFFFVSYEGRRVRLPQTFLWSVPTIALRQSVPASVRPLLDAYPLPNGRELSNGFAEATLSASNPSSADAVSVRLDHSFALGTTARPLTLFGRFNHAPSERDLRSTAPTLQRQSERAQTLTLGSTGIIGSRFINELRVNVSRGTFNDRHAYDGIGGGQLPSDLMLFGPNASGATTRFNLTIPTAQALRFGAIIDSEQQQLNIVDTLTWVRGAHQFKGGFDYRRLNVTVAPALFRVVAFLNMPDLLSGTTSQFSFQNVQTAYPLFENFGLFAQDTWTASDRLTLTYGLRWDVTPPPGVRQGPSPRTLNPVGDPPRFELAPEGSPIYRTSYRDVAPRVGFAYQLNVRPGWETTIRGGTGLFYDIGSAKGASSFGLPPYTRTVNFGRQPFPINPAIDAPPALELVPPFVAEVADADYRMPFTVQWNTAIEQALGSRQSVSLSYVGAAGRRLPGVLQYVNPSPTFSTVLLTASDYASEYHSLQAQWHRRLSGGIQALASYTWSVAEDDGSFDHNADTVRRRAAADFDVRHNLAISLSYQVPHPAGKLATAALGGWWVDGIARARSALPFNVLDPTFVVIEGVSTQRLVTRAPDLPLYLDDPLAPGGRRLNDAVDPSRPGCKGPYCSPLSTQYESLGRNAVRGHAMAQVDLALRRRFQVSRLLLEARAEVFNVFNRANFGQPDGNLTSGTFGRSTAQLNRGLGSVFNPLYQIGGPRSVQLALKVSF